MNYYSKKEVLEHFNLHEFPTTNLGNCPINPKTGKPYTENSWQYWLWFYGLDDESKGIIADFEAQIYI